MRIEKLSPAPDRAGRYQVRFDNGDTLRLYRQTVEDFGLYSGMEMTEEDFVRLQESAGQMSAKMRAVRIVAAASVSKDDLPRRLIQKGEGPQQAKAAVDWMSEMSLVDDRATAEHIVARCIAKGYGLSRAKQALYEKRIPKEYWDAVLRDYPDQIDKIMEFLESHLGESPDQKTVKRAVDALLRRGHSYGTIRRAMREMAVDSDEFPEG